jgi:glycerol-3-phosphate dehydrogenase (NAD(P)+)
MDASRLHARAREQGANPFVYWLARAVLQPFFHLYFRLSRVGREHIPDEGPVIFAANHRSFLDPFVIGTLIRRPMYYVAKKELFAHRWQAWVLNALGAFPVDRGASDGEMMRTARAILDRGDCVLIFPEGTRIRPGGLARPKRGVGRLALATGAPVVPVAVIGTEAVRRGWRIRPHKVRIRCGRPLRFPRVESPSPALAGAVTERLWPCVALQWEWLGGLPPLRRAAVVGAGAPADALAGALTRAGLDVRVGGEDVDLAGQDLVCFAVAARALPGALAAHGPSVPASAGVVVLSTGLVPPLGTLPSAYACERTAGRATACLGGPGRAVRSLDGDASLVVGCADAPFARQLADTLTAAGLDVSTSSDVTGVELAGCAKDAAALAAAAARPAGANVAGAAAGKVFAEVEAYARRRGAHPETFAGLAGAGDLVATVLAESSGGEAAEAVPLLAGALQDANVSAPTVDGLAELIAGRIDPEDWSRTVVSPGRGRPVRAA